MPKLEAKAVQKEVEAGRLRPVYWLYGPERMKSRELLKRIKALALGDGATASFGEENLDGAIAKAIEVVDAARSLSLGGGLRFVVVRDAHQIKDAEVMGALFEPGNEAREKSELPYVCVFLSNDLDGRKKFSKQLVENAAVVPCEEVAEGDREGWIGFLAKRRELVVTPQIISQLRGLDPWSLDIIDSELEKYALCQDEAVLLGSVGEGKGTDAFLEALFSRDLKRGLASLEGFVDSPDQTLPLLGLLAWNVRFLALVISDRENRTRFAKLSPFLAERFMRWSRHWSLADALELQSALAKLDFDAKQTPKTALGLWASLIQRFGK